MSREQALKEIKVNWKRLIKEGKLSDVLKKYFEVYHKDYTELPIKMQENPFMS